MRLFYAITFDENVRRKLAGIQDALRVQAVRGNFTLFENLHLTVAFIGEVPPARAEQLIAIAEAFHLTPVQMQYPGRRQLSERGRQYCLGRCPGRREPVKSI